MQGKEAGHAQTIKAGSQYIHATLEMLELNYFLIERLPAYHASTDLNPIELNYASVACIVNLLFLSMMFERQHLGA